MLASLRAQPTAPREVVVVDQSTPRYVLEPFPGLAHLHCPELSGLTAARNRGIAATSGEIVLFFDDDVLLLSDCVAEIEATFVARPDVVGAQCAITDPSDDLPYSLWHLWRTIFEHGFFDQRPERRGADYVPRLIDGLASAYRRGLFARELFDETLTGYCLGEDWDFTKRAARRGNLVIVERARVRHEPSPNNRADVRRYLKQRRENTLYLYDKLHAGRDLRERLWKLWWVFGEELRAFKVARTRPLR